MADLTPVPEAKGKSLDEVVGPFDVYYIYCFFSALKRASTPSSIASQLLHLYMLNHPNFIQNQRLERLQTAKEVCGKTWQPHGARMLTCLTASHKRTPAPDLRTPQPGPGIVNSSWH